MTLIFKRDLMAAADALDDEARAFVDSLPKARLSDEHREEFVRRIADPRRVAAARLRDAARALDAIIPIGISPGQKP